MAVTIATGGQGGVTGGTTSFGVGFTPVANGLAVIAVHVSHADTTMARPSATGLSTTWTVLADYISSAAMSGSPFYRRMTVLGAQFGSSPPGAGTATVALDSGGTLPSNGAAYAYTQVTGHNTATPVRQSGTATGTTSPITFNLSSPLTTSRALLLLTMDSFWSQFPTPSSPWIVWSRSATGLNVQTQWQPNALDYSSQAMGGDQRWFSMALELAEAPPPAKTLAALGVG
jgi:hypothetical protein